MAAGGFPRSIAALVAEAAHPELHPRTKKPLARAVGAAGTANPLSAADADQDPITRDTSPSRSFDTSRVNGAEAPGTDTFAGTLQFGVATLLTRAALLDPDARDFRITAAVPIR